MASECPIPPPDDPGWDRASFREIPRHASDTHPFPEGAGSRDGARRLVIAGSGAGVGIVAFALGANLGDALGALRQAARGLAAVLEGARASSVYETPAEGGDAQPPYLNAVVVGRGTLTPGDALQWARALERSKGRERPYPGAPRTLDVDVLFVGDAIVDQADLRVPHPRWRSRAFVGVPLLEVAPELVDPESGRTVADWADELGWKTAGFRVVREQGFLLEEDDA